MREMGDGRGRGKSGSRWGRDREKGKGGGKMRVAWGRERGMSRRVENAIKRNLSCKLIFF